MLRCKRQSQLPRYRSPVRPHVLHSLPHGYGEGDLDAIADRTNPSTRDALGTTKIATGQHQGCSLVYRSPYRSMNFTRPTTELYAGLTATISTPSR